MAFWAEMYLEYLSLICGQVLEPLPTIRGFEAFVQLDPASKDQFCAPHKVPIHLEGEVHDELKCLDHWASLCPAHMMAFEMHHQWFGL